MIINQSRNKKDLELEDASFDTDYSNSKVGHTFGKGNRRSIGRKQLSTNEPEGSEQSYVPNV